MAPLEFAEMIFIDRLCTGLVPMLGAVENVEVQMLTVDEVAQLMRVSRVTSYRLAARGELPGRKIGRVWRFPEDAIQE